MHLHIVGPDSLVVNNLHFDKISIFGDNSEYRSVAPTKLFTVVVPTESGKVERIRKHICQEILHHMQSYFLGVNQGIHRMNFE